MQTKLIFTRKVLHLASRCTVYSYGMGRQNCSNSRLLNFEPQATGFRPLQNCSIRRSCKIEPKKVKGMLLLVSIPMTVGAEC